MTNTERNFGQIKEALKGLLVGIGNNDDVVDEKNKAVDSKEEYERKILSVLNKGGFI